MLRQVTIAALVLAVAGCSQFRVPFRKPADPVAGAPMETVAAEPAAAVPSPTALTPEQFDTTTGEQRAAAAAAAPVSGESRLGTTIASLGDPADPGFWAETGLVSEVRQGRLEYPATGKSVAVELRPSGGAPGSGTRVSLPALRVLEAPLTDLPELVVYGG
ncbi:D-galactarate dehydratase [Tropicimonas aquimaris]|uniref:D-galactarate dehydratase n=1 Tax=Tropicimonas aquimaris TaxID=914152 RepID=A0ABW3ISM2_9RHOB